MSFYCNRAAANTQVAIKERTIPKTTSGKIQRRLTRTRLHEGELAVVMDLVHDPEVRPFFDVLDTSSSGERFSIISRHGKQTHNDVEQFFPPTWLGLCVFGTYGVDAMHWALLPDLGKNHAPGMADLIIVYSSRLG